ncbi:MAG: carboxypeptidase-like regulatory domain-containing protein [Rhizobacter sp.]|nr:carboxypeptidase-like regulatory domain-containing protein [Ferruginibacter sp.]
MPAQPNHIHWGVDDFERYHSGKMTEAEMHALEKAALDDPFLGDALEGYAYTKTPVADIAALKEKIWPEEEDDKIPVIWYRTRAMSQLFKAAAVLVIFGGLGWLIFNNSNGKKEKTSASIVANNNTSTGLQDSINRLYNLNDTAPIFAKVDAEEISAGLKKDNVAGTFVSPVIITPPEQNEFKINTPAESDDLVRSENQVKDKASILVSPAYKPAAPVTKAMGAKVAQADVRYQDEVGALSNRTVVADTLAKFNGFYKNLPVLVNSQVRGRVVDNSGKPVPFANVQNAANRQAVAADADGNFLLNNSDAANNNVRIEVTAAGYEQAKTMLNNNSANNTVVLNQSETALNEVVVAGYDKRKAKKENYQWNGKNSRIQLKNAEPLEGWDYFYYVMNDSITKNKMLNQQKGRMILQFDTDSNGAIKNVIVKKSLNDSADNAARRILYKSPVLKIKSKQNKAEATIKLGL